jgi:hypothetical protein
LGLGTTDQLGGWPSAGAVIATTAPQASAPAATSLANRPKPGISSRHPTLENAMRHLTCLPLPATAGLPGTPGPALPDSAKQHFPGEQPFPAKQIVTFPSPTVSILAAFMFVHEDR